MGKEWDDEPIWLRRTVGRTRGSTEALPYRDVTMVSLGERSYLSGATIRGTAVGLCVYQRVEELVKLWARESFSESVCHVACSLDVLDRDQVVDDQLLHV